MSAGRAGDHVGVDGQALKFLSRHVEGLSRGSDAVAGLPGHFHGVDGMVGVVQRVEDVFQELDGLVELHADVIRVHSRSDNVRIKRGGPLQHLKSYEVDGLVLRTGSANFSASGENDQDNDLVVDRDPADAARFEAKSEKMWSAAAPMIEFAPAIKALEPRG